MKYLKKIFESKSDQYEIVEDYFLHLLDEQDENSEEGPIWFEMDDAGESETYCVFRTFYNWNNKAHSLEAFTDFIEAENKKLAYLNGLNTILKRLTSAGYNWEFEEDEGSSTVLIYYKRETEETLEYALEPLIKGGRAVHESVLKRVLKNKYNLTLQSTNYTPGTSGYYGNNPQFMLWFPKDNFDYEHPFYKDLEKLRIKAISSIDIRRYADERDGTYFKIVLQG
jgi:hypothetical protein